MLRFLSTSRYLWKLLFLTSLVSMAYIFVSKDPGGYIGIKYILHEDNFKDIINLPPMHPRVIKYIQKHHLTPPSPLPYNMSPPGTVTLTEFPFEVKQILGRKQNGFFIEAGACDGEFFSNTIEIERNQNWTGLLVEASPVLWEKLLSRHRKAWASNVCLSPYNNISEIEFADSKNPDAEWKAGIGKIILPDDSTNLTAQQDLESLGYTKRGKVKCFPFMSLLKALGVTHVDYLSLDVQGLEFKILKTLPFNDELTIDYIQVENEYVPEGQDAIENFLVAKGYEIVSRFNYDLIFRSTLAKSQESSSSR